MKRYLTYKNSGIKWIDEIPKDWQIMKLKQLGVFSASGINKKTIEDEVAVKMINYTDIYGNQNCELNNDKNYMIVSCPQEKKRIHQVEKGDLIFTPSSETVEDIGLSALINESLPDTVYSYHVIRFQFKKPVSHRYKKFFCNNNFVLNQFSKCAKGTTRQILGRDDFKNVEVILPPNDEQQKASTYLDKRTSQIDVLLAQKERMIEFLKEERTAIINQAVTKGLDPNVEMKDSNIEWLGEIPKHWDVKKLKFNAFIRFSSVDKKSEEGEENVKLCNYVDVYYNDCITLKLDFMKATASVEEIRKFQLHIGDVIVTKDSESWNDITVPAYVAESEDKLLCGYHLAQIKPDVRVLNGKFLFWVLSGNAFNYQYQVETTGVTRYGLSNYALSNSFIVLPPIAEQKKIGSYLDKKTTQIHEQIEREKRLIKLLKEYRTALISEVVTGKIDVRGGRIICRK